MVAVYPRGAIGIDNIDCKVSILCARLFQAKVVRIAITGPYKLYRRLKIALKRPGIFIPGLK
jgi:hypothetical protein